MTKKDYKLVARTINQEIEQRKKQNLGWWDIVETAQNLAKSFKQDNFKFKEIHFLIDCGAMLKPTEIKK